MAKDKYGGDSTSVDVHLVLNGKVVMATWVANTLRCLDAVWAANGSLIFTSHGGELDQPPDGHLWLEGCIPAALESGATCTSMS